MRSRGGPWLALALCCAALPARAHAPLARGLALAPEGGGIALRMPGFGLLLRGGEAEPFRYACDALLGLAPTDSAAPFAYRGDGALLIGTGQGVRIVGANGCPVAEASDLPAAPVVALAVHTRDRLLVYAVIAGADAGFYRSRDGGVSWELRSPIAAGTTVSALQLDAADPEVVYLSQVDVSGPAIARSADGGGSFAVTAQARELVLLAVESGPPARLWARARKDAVRGADILRAESAAGPWQPVLSVNFFGGFSVEPDSGAIWVGDEGGGVYRSSDGSESFAAVLPKTAVACLSHANGALWACTPGTSTQRALASWSAAASDFEAVMAFADVDRLVECAPEVGVAQLCAAAWHEWQVDVLGAGGPSAVSGRAGGGGAPGAASGGGSGSGSGGAGGEAALVPEPEEPEPDPRPDAAGCAAVPYGRANSAAGCAATLFIAAVALAAFRRLGHAGRWRRPR
jgi:hypothetical protein